jgi:hypothetical protein
MAKKVLVLSMVVILGLSSCNLPATPQTPPAPSPTSTQTGGMMAVTDTLPASQTTQAVDSGPLCDNDYFPNDDGNKWTYSGNNSATGDYTRTDEVTDSTDYGFTTTTTLTKVTYDTEFTCTEAGLINLLPAGGWLSAVFSGPSGTVEVTPTMNTGITLPKEFQPADTWDQYLAWNASSPKVNQNGSFNYHYTAMGSEVVTVPFGTFDAMRIDATIDVEMGTYQKMNGAYTTSVWWVQDIGPVKMEGSMDMPGLKFTDTLELVSYDSP